MPRPPNKKAIKYDNFESRVARATQELRENPKSKLKNVASANGLTRKTLYNRYYGRTHAARAAHPEQQVLTTAQEEAVVRWVERRDALGFPPKHKELVRMVVAIRQNENGVQHHRLGNHFTMRFLKRHPQIATTVAHAMNRDRVMAINRGNINGYFNRLYDVIHRNHIDPQDMWNFDEKGFLMGQGGKRNELVISRVRTKGSRRMQDGSREWVSLLECVSAVGKRIPAYFIYAGQAHYDGWHHGSVGPDTGFYFTDNGWTNDKCSLYWLTNHFAKHCPPSHSGATRLLICNNHSSHDTYEFIEYCLDNNIALFFLPSHSTHILQPLDVGIFEPLDRFCGQEVDTWLATQPLHTRLHKGDFIPMCEKARRRAITYRNITAAWAKCGIHPFNWQQILENPNFFWNETDTVPLQRNNDRPTRQGQKPVTKIEKILAHTPHSLQEAKDKITTLGEEARRVEAELAVTKHELHQALTREKPAKASRKVLSTARYATRRQLETARHARLAEDKKKQSRKRKAGPPTGPNKRSRRDDPDNIQASDSEVGRQVAVLMDADMDIGSNHQKRATQSGVGQTETDAQLHEISGNASLRGGKGRYNSTKQGKKGAVDRG